MICQYVTLTLVFVNDSYTLPVAIYSSLASKVVLQTGLDQFFLLCSLSVCLFWHHISIPGILVLRHHNNLDITLIFVDRLLPVFNVSTSCTNEA